MRCLILAKSPDPGLLKLVLALSRIHDCKLFLERYQELLPGIDIPEGVPDVTKLLIMSWRPEVNWADFVFATDGFYLRAKAAAADRTVAMQSSFIDWSAIMTPRERNVKARKRGFFRRLFGRA